MKIVNITPLGKRKVYDISVEDVEHYVLENGVVTHNTGIYYSADNIWIVGRSQDKDGTEVVGYHFNINIEKSRFVKEKSKIPIHVTWEDGISKWSGFLELALEGGYVAKPKNGWYCVVDQNTKEHIEPNMREAQIIDNKEIWTKILKETDFAKFIKNKFAIGDDKQIANYDEDQG